MNHLVYAYQVATGQPPRPATIGLAALPRQREPQEVFDTDRPCWWNGRHELPVLLLAHGSRRHRKKRRGDRAVGRHREPDQGPAQIREYGVGLISWLRQPQPESPFDRLARRV